MRRGDSEPEIPPKKLTGDVAANKTVAAFNDNVHCYFLICLKVKNPAAGQDFFNFRREDRIRTCDPLVPNQVRYRPALLPDSLTVTFVKVRPSE